MEQAACAKRGEHRSAVASGMALDEQPPVSSIHFLTSASRQAIAFSPTFTGREATFGHHRVDRRSLEADHLLHFGAAQEV